MDYKLLDSGDFKKLEKFGNITLARPCSSAIWRPKIDNWNSYADAEFIRVGEDSFWKFKGKNLTNYKWIVSIAGVSFVLKITDFGHVGVFPEHSQFWPQIQDIASTCKDIKVLNLFAYTGGASIAAANSGATVTHVDASKAAVRWATENTLANDLPEKRISWVVDDVFKFLARENRRGKLYDIIILDPPSFGRGTNGETFKIEEHLLDLLLECKKLLSDTAKMFILSTHTPGFTPISVKNLLQDVMSDSKVGKFECGEMLLPGEVCIPSGVFATWSI